MILFICDSVISEGGIEDNPANLDRYRRLK